MNVASALRLAASPMPTVLCIDDHTYSLACMREMLRVHGYKVLWAESAQDAIGFLLQNPADALLLDCTLSGDKSHLLAVVEQLDIPIVMMPDYCSMPCRSLHRADTCRQKAGPAEHSCKFWKSSSLPGGMDRSIPSQLDVCRCTQRKRAHRRALE